MGIFGWSYPPGCSGPPENDGPCECCGNDENNCICPECPECGDVGNPKCYVSGEEQNHGLIKSQAQIDSLTENEKKWKEDNERFIEAEKLAHQMEIDEEKLLNESQPKDNP